MSNPTLLHIFCTILTPGPRNSLFAGDGSHASSSGTYLTALTMLETIWPGVSGVGNLIIN